MFEENENLAVEEIAENVEEETTEEIVEGEEVTAEEEETQEEITEKKYSDEEVDEIVKKRLARAEKKYQRELEKKYKDDLELAYIVKQGTGYEDTKEASNQMREFYTNNNISIPEYKPEYAQRRMEAYAKAEADEIINLGYDYLVEEVDRMASIGFDKMNPEEKLIFNKLASERKQIEDSKELAKIGVSKDLIDSKEFQDFCSDLNPSLSISKKYELYSKLNPKKETKPLGSMKNTNQNKKKEFYTDEEISKLSLEDLDNDEIWEAVRNSMTQK